MFTLSQALEAIKNKPEFSAKDRGLYTVIDYNLSDRDTFVGSTPEETKILLNLRGTIFLNSTGEIIRLMFDKFFNYGEFPDSDAKLDFSKSHSITQKLDGSCIGTFYVPGSGYLFGTRAGVTDIAMMALDFAENSKASYLDLIETCSQLNCTPIFEFCSRKNRVVIDYPQDKLVLTAVRNMDTGKYISYDTLKLIGSDFRVPVVDQMSSVDQKSFNDFKKKVSELEDDEGVVIRFDETDHMVKLKSSQYVLQHKAVDQLKFAKDVLALALSGKLDDVLPLLSKDKEEQVNNFTQHFFEKIDSKCFEIIDEYNKYSKIELQKDFAEAVKNSSYKSFFFKIRKGELIYLLLTDYALKQCSTIPLCESLQEFLNMEVKY